MGRLIKNEQINTGSNAIRVPVGDTSSRPSAPVTGQIRFNTDTNKFEMYHDTWKEVAVDGSTTNVVIDNSKPV